MAKLVRQHTATTVDLTARAAELARRYQLPDTALDPLRRATRPAAGDRAHRPPARSASAIASPAFPGWVLDAVIVHELAHLVEANHSPAFHVLADRYPKQERAHGFLLAMQLTDDDVDDYGGDRQPGEPSYTPSSICSSARSTAKALPRSLQHRRSGAASRPDAEGTSPASVAPGARTSPDRLNGELLPAIRPPRATRPAAPDPGAGCQS